MGEIRMMHLKNLGSFESVPSLDDWNIVLDLRPKMESYVKDSEND